MPVSYRVNLETGAREVLSGDAAGISTCESGGVQLGFRGGEVDANGKVARGRFAGVLDDSVQDLDAFGDLSMRLGCLDDAMVLWDPGERSVVLARYSMGSVTQERVRLPAGSSEIRLVNQRNLGQTVAVWARESTGFQLWQLRVDGWERCGLRAPGIDPTKVVAVVGCDAIAANPTTGTLNVVK